MYIKMVVMQMYINFDIHHYNQKEKLQRALTAWKQPLSSFGQTPLQVEEIILAVFPDRKIDNGVRCLFFSIGHITSSYL